MDILMHYGMKHQGKIFKIYVITSKGKIKNYHLLLPNATGRIPKGQYQSLSPSTTQQKIWRHIEKDITKRESYFVRKKKGK